MLSAELPVASPVQDVSNTNPFFQTTKCSGQALKKLAAVGSMPFQPHPNVGCIVPPSTFTHAIDPAWRFSFGRKRLARKSAPSERLKMFVLRLRSLPITKRSVLNTVPVPLTVTSLTPFVQFIVKRSLCPPRVTSVSFVPPVCTKSPVPRHPAYMTPVFFISKNPPFWRNAPKLFAHSAM